MKYNGFYFWLFSKPMKQVLTEKYDRVYADSLMKKSKQVYRQLVEAADDIGDDNPMAYNELFALAFVAPYIASDKAVPPETIQEMMRRALYHIKWYFGRTDLNTEKGKAEKKKHHPVCQMVHAGKRAAVPHLLQGGFCRSAPLGSLLLPHHPLSDLRLHPKAGCFGIDAAFLRAGQCDDHAPARRSPSPANDRFRRRLL